MKEQLISFETAKLAKEKGFGIEPYITLHTYYREDGTLITEPRIWKRDPLSHRRGALQLSGVEVGISPGMDNSCEEVLAPTQSLLQKWLREVCKITIFINTFEVWNNDGNSLRHVYDYSLRKLLPLGSENIGHTPLEYKTYEEALEAGLLEALKIIEI